MAERQLGSPAQDHGSCVAEEESVSVPSIVPFIPADVEFDPETLAIVGAAFDKARAALAVGQASDIAEDVLARQIITIAHGGERDSDRLCAQALGIFGVPLPRTAA